MKIKMQSSEQFMEIKAYDPIGEAFDFKSKRFYASAPIAVNPLLAITMSRLMGSVLHT